MKKTIFVETKLSIFSLLLLLVLTISGVGQAEEDLLRVSVFDFTGNYAAEYRNEAVTSLTRTLIEIGRFRVIERAEMDRILEEQKFQMTGLVDQTTAIEIGKLAAVDVAFLGNIDRIQSKWINSKYGGFYETEVKVTVKIIEISSGKLLHIIENKGSSADANQKISVSDAMRNCFGESFAVAVRERFALEATVVKTAGRMVYFLSGKGDGVKKGLRYRVMRRDDDFLTDLQLDTSDAFMTQIGLVEVLEVTENFAKATVLWKNAEIEQGDFLKEQARVNRFLLASGLQIKKFQAYSKYGLQAYGAVPFIEVRTITERPFDYISGFTFGMGTINEVIVCDTGYELGKELGLIPGFLYLTASGIGGVSMALQDYRQFYYGQSEIGTAWSMGWYAAGTTGLKLYPTRDKGFCLEVGLIAQYGPRFQNWYKLQQFDIEESVTNWVNTPVMKMSALGLRAGIGLQF